MLDPSVEVREELVARLGDDVGAHRASVEHVAGDNDEVDLLGARDLGDGPEDGDAAVAQLRPPSPAIP